jgi:hypothetical protein
MTLAANAIASRTGTPRRAARRVAWTALALASTSAFNTIVTATIVATQSYDRFVPDSIPPFPKSTFFRLYAPAAIAHITVHSCVASLAAVALAVAALFLQKKPGALRGTRPAVGAIVLALASAVAAGVANVACSWQLTPWPFG